MDEIASFGEWLRRRRKALDLTQADLAQCAGCVAGTIKSIEADARRPSRQLAERLAECLDVTPEQRLAFLKAARAELATSRLATPIITPTPPPPTRRPIDRPQPQVLRGYTLGDRLGSGGFGAVYRAEQPGVGRMVAVKIILPDYANHPDFIRHFEA